MKERKEYNQQEDSPAVKDDKGKASLELLPPSYWEEVESPYSFEMALWYFYKEKFPYSLPGYDSVPILEFGKCKYQSHNWFKGMRWGRLVGAFHRHCNYKDEETGLWLPRSTLNEPDDESKMAHGSHAECCRVFLQEYYKAWNHGIIIGENDCAWNEGEIK